MKLHTDDPAMLPDNNTFQYKIMDFRGSINISKITNGKWWSM